MKEHQSSLFGPTVTEFGPIDEKTVLSKKEKEELIADLRLKDDDDESMSENSQSAPDEIISNPQEIQKEAKKSREANCS